MLNISSDEYDALHRAVVAQMEEDGVLGKNTTREQLLEFALRVVSGRFEGAGQEEKKAAAVKLVDRIHGLGPLEEIMRDPSITEIMVNGADSVFIEKNGLLLKSDIKFSSHEEVLRIINKIVGDVGRRIDESSPYVDARLKDGSRVHAIIPPLALTGPVLTIRRFSKEPYTMEKLLQNTTLSEEMAEFLKDCVVKKLNILISGGTGTGKTTTLNALSGLVPPGERLVTIEDSAEIRIDHPHWVRLESRGANIEGRGEITIRTLLKNALRMRPDRIIIGEIRGGEALDMLQAMNTGHQGSLTTVHANAPEEALMRVETMALMTELELPLDAIREQIKSAINIIVHEERLGDGSRKVVAIYKLLKGKGPYNLNTVFEYDKEQNAFVKNKEYGSN